MGTSTRSWDVEEVRAKLRREQGPTALQILRVFEQRLDSKYSESAVTSTTHRFASGWMERSRSLSGGWEE